MQEQSNQPTSDTRPQRQSESRSLSELAAVMQQAAKAGSVDTIKDNMAELNNTLHDVFKTPLSEMGIMQRQANLQLVRTINKDLLSIKDQLGEDDQAFVSKFAKVSDEMTRNNSLTAAVMGELKESVIDGKGKMVSAFMGELNPLVKASINAGKGAYDVYKKIKDKTKPDDESGKSAEALTYEPINKSAAAQVGAAVAQEAAADAQEATTDALRENNKETAKANREARQRGSTYTQTLEAINTSMQSMVQLASSRETPLAGATPVGATSALATSTTPVNDYSGDLKDTLDWLDLQADYLKSINTNMETLVQYNAGMMEIERDAARNADKSSMQRMDDDKKGGKLTPMVDPTLGEEKAGSFLDELYGSLFGMLGGNLLTKVGGFILGGVKGLFTTLFGGVTKLLKPLLGGLGVVGKFFGAFYMIFEFFNGFINASDILGREADGLWDRISAGIGSMIGSIVGIVDFVAGLFGIESNLGKWVTEGVAGFLAAIPTKIGEFFSYIGELFNFTPLVEFVTGVVDTYIENWKAVFTFIFDAIGAAFDKVKSFLGFGDDDKTPKPDGKQTPAGDPVKQTPAGEAKPKSGAVSRFGSVEKASQREMSAMDDAIGRKQQVASNTNISSSNKNTTNNNTTIQAPNVTTRNSDDLVWNYA